jgi:hypothetical protein
MCSGFHDFFFNFFYKGGPIGVFIMQSMPFPDSLMPLYSMEIR